ncbi:MAG TPA: tRNA adenosine(34) deaminase TadA [Nitrospiraceae bacterium]|jgi:tRNA(adenine34) deaminase|nr:tRNA adenosine(34) deaminase TadA [Nitrospirota bacterium]HTK87914.1 tRNA adenosine(34) deaminase TadA [Nitrospiraceae bacterium]
MSFISDRDVEFMQMALDQARLAPALGEVPIAAVIVMDGQLLSQVHNFREVWQDPTAHAEVVAIREAATRLKTWRLTGTTMYVTIEPCSMCAGAIIQARVSRLVFGARDPKAGACGSVFNLPSERRLNHRVEVCGGVLELESQELMQTFFRRLRQDVSERIPLENV